MNGIYPFRDEASPVSGRHVRSLMGMRSISVGYKIVSSKRSAIGAESFEI